MPGSPLAQTTGKFQQQKLVAAVFPGLNQQVLAFLGISTFISLGLADDSLHPSEGLQKIRFPPPLYSVLHEGRFECPGQSGTDLRRRVLPAVVCRFFEVCINPETAEPFPLVNSQDERDPPAADKYECFCSCGSQEGKSRECFYPR